MSIKIRPIETKCTMTLSKENWLGVLVFINQYKEQAATEEIDKILKECASIIRSFIFRKGGSGDLCLELDKQDALEFYLHLKDFYPKVDADQKEPIDYLIETIKIYLIEGKHEQQS